MVSWRRIMLFFKVGDVLLIGVAFYDLFNGPCVGYCYDLNNRITYPSEDSMAIVMFGLNFGASLVPYITALTWERGGGPESLMIAIFINVLTSSSSLHDKISQL
jgi:hypothetical protein